MEACVCVCLLGFMRNGSILNAMNNDVGGGTMQSRQSFVQSNDYCLKQGGK